MAGTDSPHYTHGNHNICRWNNGQQLVVLCLFHVDVIKLFHKPHGILIYLLLYYCSGRIALKRI